MTDLIAPLRGAALVNPLAHLIGHRIAHVGRELPPVEAAMYEYVLAANGLFVRGKREGLEATVPVYLGDVRGALAAVEPEVVMRYPKVPRRAVDAMLTMARDVEDERGHSIEILFHLAWSGYDWKLTVPEQVGTTGNVRPVYAGADSSYASALIEVHSHHRMSAFWSGTDNKDEQGFRLYAVLGNIFRRPELRVRVGLYGHFLEVPAESIFNLPDGVNEPGDGTSEPDRFEMPDESLVREIMEIDRTDGTDGTDGIEGIEGIEEVGYEL